MHPSFRPSPRPPAIERPRSLPAATLLALALCAAPPSFAQSTASPAGADAPAPPPAGTAAAVPADGITGTATDHGAASASADSMAPDAALPLSEAADDGSASADGTSADDAPPPADPATAPAPPADPRTDAERDFDALYGPYDPVADPTLPPPAQVRGAYDPWEPLNRRVHRFNNVVDRTVARPLARTYVKVVPRPVRLGVGNFFNNLGQPVSALNALLQGKPGQAAQSLGRFVLNTTLGIGGIFDPASDAKLPNRSEDFGQTLGVWGWKRSRYVELPLFGPRTLRDVFGMVGDAPLSPLRQVDADKVRVPVQGMQLVDIRAQLLSTDSLREGAEDDYALVRDAWSQRRDYQIFGDRQLEGDETLPDYLREENNPTVPVDAMPMMPTDGS